MTLTDPFLRKNFHMTKEGKKDLNKKIQTSRYKTTKNYTIARLKIE